MSKVRYVKSADELRLAAQFDPEFLPSSTRQIRARYETDPELIAAVLPPPLQPGSRPEVGVTISEVKVHMAPGFDIEIGAAIFGVSAVYDGVGAGVRGFRHAGGGKLSAPRRYRWP